MPWAGLHTDDASFEQLIAGFRFAQGPAAKTWGMSSPPHTPTFADIPPEVGVLFRRCFERGSEAGTRPRALEWVPILQQLEQAITDCKADPGHKYWKGAASCVWCRLTEKGGPEYFFGVAGLATFAVDEARLQEILRRLEATQAQAFNYNRNAFKPASLPPVRPLPNELVPLKTRLDDLAKRRSLQQEQDRVDQKRERQERAKRERQYEAQLERALSEKLTRLDEELEEATEAVAIERKERRLLTRVLFMAALTGLLIAPIGFREVVVGVIGLGVLLIFGAWLVVHLHLAHSTPAYRHLRGVRSAIKKARWDVKLKMKEEYERNDALEDKADSIRAERVRKMDEAVQKPEEAYLSKVDEEAKLRRGALERSERRLQSLETAWMNHQDAYQRDHKLLSAKVRDLVADCRGLATIQQTEMQRITAHAESLARLRHMRLHLIADAEIPKIGPGRQQILASFGISTAADIDEGTILSIKGFGEALTNNLLAWRDEVRRRFRFDPQTAVSSPDCQLLTANLRTRQQHLLAEANQKLAELDSLASACRAALNQLVPDLRAAVAEYEHARAELRVVTGDGSKPM
jgi:hypothetical protein